jgi:hypothetical protein
MISWTRRLLFVWMAVLVLLAGCARSAEKGRFSAHVQAVSTESQGSGKFVATYLPAGFWRNENKDAFIRRADEAWNKCFHVLHDLEANGFFIEIATASSQIPFEGLYHWAGEATARAIYRQQKAALAPDGWGRYLHPGKEISFFLEWDRATESPHRLRAKVMTYVTHFASVGEFAGLHNVIFVAPTEVREDAIQGVIETCLQSVASTCSFWTTHVELVQAVGALGRVWRGVGAGERICLTELPSAPRSKRPAGDCIAKPQWWVRRPGGGEVA